MGLFEASQLCIEGESILDEAGCFCEQLLNAWLIRHLDHDYQASVVGNTLGNPYHKSLARFMAKKFLGNFTGTNGWLNDLHHLAKIDFNMVQSIHQKEIVQISKLVKQKLDDLLLHNRRDYVPYLMLVFLILDGGKMLVWHRN